MGESLKKYFNQCLKNNKIRKFPEGLSLVSKEFKAGKHDLSQAKKNLKANEYKWSIIQSYYALFHLSRALLYTKGFREQSHYCLRIAIGHLYVESGLLEERFLDAIQMAKAMREEADYENIYSKESASSLISIANDYLKRVKFLIKK